MDKSLITFFLMLLGFSMALFGIHYYILMQFFDGTLALPLWAIYLFNAALVFIVFSVLKYYSKHKSKDMLKIFLIMTIIKMVLAVILLLPLFLNKTEHSQLEVFNFFIPYFMFLTFEIYSVNKFLQKS